MRTGYIYCSFTMAQLDRLPIELVESILDCASKAELWRLSLVCKALGKLSSPRLYKDISWRWSGDERYRNPPIHILFRSILQKPELASQIIHLELGGDLPVTIWRRPDFPMLNTDDFELIIGLIRNIGFPDPELCLRHVIEGSLNIFVALLISQLHNLRYLGIGWKLHRHNDYLISVFGSATLSVEGLIGLSSFRLLKQVDFTLDDDEMPVDPQVAGLEMNTTLALLSIPSLESIRTVARERLSGYPPHVSQISLHSQTIWGLTTLVLEHSNVTPESLTELLACTKNLLRLSYEYWGDVDARPVPCYFRSDQLVPALEHVKTTLQSLRISVRFLSNYTFRMFSLHEYVLVGILGSLRSFQALRNLEIPIGVLLGPSANDNTLAIGDVLPGGLRHLLLSDDGAASEGYKWLHYEFLDCCSEYLSQPRTATPDLSSFSLKVATGYSWSSTEIDAELKGLCDASNLDYSVQDNEKFYKGCWKLF